MDIRSEVFNLITRDVALRVLPVVEADRVHPGTTSRRPASGTCFIALEWAAAHEPGAPTGAQLLTVRAHLPNRRSGEHLLLFFLLQRVRMILTEAKIDMALTCHDHAVLAHGRDIRSGTYFKSRRFLIAPLQAAQRLGPPPLRLAVWTGTADLLRPEPDESSLPNPRLN
jgi:hypothetical protein